MLLIFALMVGVISINGQDIQKDSTGLPGDNFNLQGTLDLFSKANDLESFEKSINDEKNNVNNLDLNGDGQIDYIKVIDRTDGNAHAIVLQAVLGNNDNQDIAVIEIEKKGNEDAVAQIVGDEDIYGKEVYVEANSDNSSIDDDGNQIRKGPAAYSPNTFRHIYVNVWFWPCVQYIYSPRYIVYVSPWHWHSYPMWWRPWRPWHWHTFYHGGWHYHHHYVVVSHPRVYGARKVYAPHRVVSNNVEVRNKTVINNYRIKNNIVIDKNDSRHRGSNNNDNPAIRENMNSRTRQSDPGNMQNGSGATKSDRNTTDQPRRDNINRNNSSDRPTRVDRPTENGTLSPSRDQQPAKREERYTPMKNTEKSMPDKQSNQPSHRQPAPQRMQRDAQPGKPMNSKMERQRSRSSDSRQGIPSSRRG
ncbi:MAG TPA: hypothetical protein PLQ53_09910 [Saprospiraceae bacterium]|nr:hypothetical protein [Saprospiraceae bacterium]HNF22736.1 hypothetical protein [Saprospiraceae bacterium]HRN34495.1 hypothetical protein [Saprospiraceae bacterium]